MIMKVGRFFPTASKKKGISTLEACDLSVLLSVTHKQFIDLTPGFFGNKAHQRKLRLLWRFRMHNA